MSKQLTTLDDLKGTIEKLKPQFKSALPNHISVDKFARVLLTAVTTNAQLQQANRTSLFGACLKAAQDGLIPDGREAALVTFKTKDGGVTAQYMPMLAGILKKVRNSGELSSITAQLVYKEDKFRYWVDADGEHIEHEPNLFVNRGDLIGVYALAKTKDGGVYIEVMTLEQIEAVRNSSRAKDHGPWAGPFAGEMVKKSAIRRLAKRLPMSSDLDQVLTRDDEITELPAPHVEEPVIEEPKKTKSSRLAKIVEAETPKTEEPEKVYAPAMTNGTSSEEDMRPI